MGTGALLQGRARVQVAFASVQAPDDVRGVGRARVRAVGRVRPAPGRAQVDGEAAAGDVDHLEVDPFSGERVAEDDAWGGDQPLAGGAVGLGLEAGLVQADRLEIELQTNAFDGTPMRMLGNTPLLTSYIALNTKRRFLSDPRFRQALARCTVSSSQWSVAGTIGQATVRALSRRGHTVVCLVRGPLPRARGTAAADRDLLHDLATLPGLLQTVDGVLDHAGR